MKNDKTIHIRLNDWDYENLSETAEQCGMTVSSLVRKMISENNCSSEKSDLKVRQEIMRELSIMCNTINELQDKVGNDYPQICGTLSEKVGRICQFLK